MTVALLITALGFSGAHLARRAARRADAIVDGRTPTAGRRDVALDLAWAVLGVLGTPRAIWLTIGWGGLALTAAIAVYPLHAGATGAIG